VGIARERFWRRQQFLDQRSRRAASMRSISFSIVGLGERHEPGRRAEHDRVAEHARSPQRQGDLRRAHIGKEVHVLDVGERDAFLLAAVAHEERVAEIEHLVVERHLFHDLVADDRHHDRDDQRRQI